MACDGWAERNHDMTRKLVVTLAAGAVGSTAVVAWATGEPGADPPGVRSVSAAVAQQSAKTHHGADSLSGVRIAGRCSGPSASFSIGHRPPFKPLRKTGSPPIDSQPVPRRAQLTAACRSGRFSLRRKIVIVRDGAGPPRVFWRDGQVPMTVRTFAIE